jgi:hypothetical protein
MIQADTCEVCGSCAHGPGCFLVTEDAAHQTLDILAWDIRLARRPNVRPACSIEHVEALVSHWMLTGNLDIRSQHRWPVLCPPPVYQDTDGFARLSELMVDRAALAKSGDNRETLASILDAIASALEQAQSGDYPPDEAEGAAEPTLALLDA